MTPVAPARLAAWAGSLVRTRRWGEARVGEAAYPAIIVIVVTALALVRMLPFRWQYEEPALHAAAWSKDPVSFLLTPINGQLALTQAAYYLESPWTQLIAALVIGLVAGYLFTRAEAIPDIRVRAVVALSLPLLPIAEPGPYIGPPNAQWWIALAFVGMALSPARRWHYPALVVGGLTGIAPCLAWPLFRDRRVLAIVIPAVIQLAVLTISDRRPLGVPISPWYLVVIAAVVLCLALARIPPRTRAAFAFVAIAAISVGAYAHGWIEDQGRYLAIPYTTIVLGVASWRR